MASIADHILTPEQTIRVAFAALDAVRIKLAVLVDDAGAIARTVSDGDLRRLLVGGATLDSPLTDLPPRDPVCFDQDTAPAVLRKALAEGGIQAVVLIDADRHPVRLVDAAALAGGILLSPPHMGAAEAGYITRAFDENYIAPAGSNLVDFEATLARLSGRAHAVALSSGTAGLHLSLRALNLRPGARIYVSDKTFVASLQPVLYERLTPVLIDCEPETWNMSPDALARALDRDAAAGQLPGAICLAHLYGQSAQMGAIMDLANAHGVPVIEDAAESLGAQYGGQASGSHGLIGVYSFNGNKIVTTSGGGAIVTDDRDLADYIRYLSTQGRDTAPHYQHSEVAYNYRMSNILAGIGLGQLDVLDERVAARRGVFARYREGLGDIKGISFQADAGNSTGNRWLTVINMDPNHIDIHPYRLMRRLTGKEVETRPSWKPMHLQPLAHGAQIVPHSDDHMVSAGLFLRCLCLPSGSSLTPEDQDYVIKTIRDVLTGGQG